MKLNPGISWFNVFSFQLLWFISWVELSICLGAMAFVLGDKDFYNFSNVGKLFGGIGSIIEAIVIAEDVALGPLFDIIGRKKLLVLG